MTFKEAIRTCLKEKYVTFSGRASRSEYWWFILFSVLAALVLVVLGFLMGGIQYVMEGGANGPGIGVIVVVIVYAVFALYMILPSISVTVRRYHDKNLSGWIYLLLIVAGVIPFVGILASIASLVITILKGTDGPNKFGDDPLGGSTEVFD